MGVGVPDVEVLKLDKDRLYVTVFEGSPLLKDLERDR